MPYVPEIDRLYLGSTRPRSGMFDSQWGGKSAVNDTGLEPIDYLKLYSTY
ncbi:MAG: hypothetical protein QG650_893 [Patescibacteria group bacterium]|nr:hypothetical protein [Patescibacteria group bacterium]